jgi:putative FMN-dependent luciferase-like monooxygenase
MSIRLGFFTRVLDPAAPAERYRLALEQIVHAERLGYDTAWVAQHHFHEDEGGLPAPLVFLAQTASRTSRIRLGTGIITLPLELGLRVAEDTSVLDIISGGRLEVGVGPGGNLSAFAAFARAPEDRHKLMSENLELMRTAWRGEALPGGDRLYPDNPGLADRVWQATFSVEGGARAGRDGDGVLLSRTQPRPAERPDISVYEIQAPILDAYYANLPPGRAPRVLMSRSVFVADNRAEAMRWAAEGLRVARERRGLSGGTLPEWIEEANSHIGTPADVIESLAADRTLERATELAVQVHSIDPPHRLTLRSLELMATVVAPALGWAGAAAPAARQVA